MNKCRIHTENDEYQIIRSLKLNRVKRKRSHEVFVEGIECIKQAVRSGAEITRIIIKDAHGLSGWGKSILEQYKDVRRIEMSRALYDNLAEKTNPSEMFITVKIKPNTLDDIRSDNPFLLVFDRPSDYGNLGSIIRSANAFHVDGIYILGHGIDVYESKVMRASLGSIFFTKIVMMESMEMLEKYIRTQKMKNNIEIVGTDSTGIASIGDCKISRPVMVIIGNEAKGMSIKLKALCDRVIRIPMEGNIDSLNVSCAASIVLWEIYKNKNGK